MSDTTQKEYLKKYLSIGKVRTGKKKKKNKQGTIPSRLTIIDDNADTFQTAVQEDLLEDDNAPQIVAIIDERPPSLQVDEKSNTNMWIPIGSQEIKTELNPSSDHKIMTNEDLSPPRFKVQMLPKRGGNMNILPQRKEIKLDDKKDKIRKMPIVPDMSPPRKRKSSTASRTRSTISPPADRKESIFPNPKQNESVEDLSPPRSKVAMKNGNSGDLSPPRPKATKSSKYDRYISPPRENLNRHSKQVIKDDIRDCDISPPRKRDPIAPPKITKTLDGKTAGLQNAEQLAAESIVLKKREEELFNKLSSEISGANASPIIRDKSTGRVLNLEEEAAKEQETRKKENVNKEKYSRWGRGLKQVEDQTKKIEEAITEMHKPLARYANDEDLERYLKEQDRAEDPMLAYMRKKRKKKDIEEGKPMKPEYMGEYMPNRFGIKPGYRWDGVDRSNGYEKKWFEIQNSKLAQQEEAYKWSTEDM